MDASASVPHGQSVGGLAGIARIVWGEVAALRRGRAGIIANLLLPSLLLIAVAAGFGGAFGRVLMGPYETYVVLEDYLLPGLVVLVALLSATRSGLSLVRDHDSQSSNLALSQLASWWLLLGKLVGAAVVGTLQAYGLLVIAWVIGVDIAIAGWLIAAPAVLAGAFMMAAAMTTIAFYVARLRMLASALLYFVLPAFVLSTALYPMWTFTDSGADYLRYVATANPLSHVVELVRYASEKQLELVSLGVVLVVGLVAIVAGQYAADPRRASMRRSKKSRGAPK